MLKEGQKAPEFNLKDQSEKSVTLADFKEKIVVLYFYPKDNTPGCTIEALDFTKLKAEFDSQNAVVLGVSKDNCTSHQKFITERNLSIMLLADTETNVQQSYGVWRMKNFMGKESMGTVRSTFLINQDGIITKIWGQVKPEGHAEEVLEEVKKLNKC